MGTFILVEPSMPDELLLHPTLVSGVTTVPRSRIDVNRLQRWAVSVLDNTYHVEVYEADPFLIAVYRSARGATTVELQDAGTAVGLTLGRFETTILCGHTLAENCTLSDDAAEALNMNALTELRSSEITSFRHDDATALIST